MSIVDCDIGSSKKIKLPPVRLPWPRNSLPDPQTGKIVPIGVDVVAKHKDIVKIVHKFFKVEGFTMEELLQEVFVAIIHKNSTRSAHDSRKSSFGHYVYLVANNCCINLVHKRRRYNKDGDSLDELNGDDNIKTVLDTVESPSPEDNKEDFFERMEAFEKEVRRFGTRDQARYIVAVRSGVGSDIVREALSWGKREISNKTIRDIRNDLREAVCDYGIPTH